MAPVTETLYAAEDPRPAPTGNSESTDKSIGTSGILTTVKRIELIPRQLSRESNHLQDKFIQ